MTAEAKLAPIRKGLLELLVLKIASFLVNKELASKVQIAVLPIGTDSGVLGNIILGAIGPGKK